MFDVFQYAVLHFLKCRPFNGSKHSNNILSMYLVKCR